MFIDNDTKLRVNIHAAYKGFSKLDTPEIRTRANVVEIADPVPPEDYSDETYYRTEQDAAPYVIFTKKSPEQLEQMADTKARDAAQRLLDSTDYLFTADRYAELLAGEPARAIELAEARSVARTTIRAYKLKYPEQRP